MAQDPSTNLPRTGAVEAPMDFRPPTPTQTHPSDQPYTTMYNPYQTYDPKYKEWESQHQNNFGGQGGYDENGYPLPSQQQVDAYEWQMGQEEKNRSAIGTTAYDPRMEPPAPDSDNPYSTDSQEGKLWKYQNDNKKWNQKAKAAWQEQHADKRKAQPSTAAPATPFASAGIDLTKEGKGESFADSVIEHFSKEGIPDTSNEAKTTLDSFRAKQPQDLSPYYDYASKLTSAKIDNAMSARGSYGSSNATGQIGAAEMALRADEAKANAQYGLDRYAQEGNLAGSADASDARGSALKYEWTKGLSDLAFKNQDAGEGRNQQLFDDNFRVAAAKAGNWTDATGKAITGVGEATDAANDVAIGNANDQVSHANADANTEASHTASIMDSAQKFGTNLYNYGAGQDATGQDATKPKAN